MKVDLVYFWCDGNDPLFINRRMDLAKKLGKENDISNLDAGFVQVNELYYSILGVKKYMPWINNIFIITDRQIPDIDLNNVKIIDHSEILDKDQIPCFNIYVLEANVYKIPNLSENFIIANDDTFVYKQTNEDFFFDKKGNPIIRFMNKEKDSVSIYQKTLDLTYNLFNNRFNCNYEHLRLHHNMDSYRRSTVQKCYEIFKSKYDLFKYDSFRTERCVHRTLWSLYDINFNSSKYKIVNNVKQLDSIYFRNTDKNILESLEKENPHLFCINDTRFSTNRDRNTIKNILYKIYT